MTIIVQNSQGEASLKGLQLQWSNHLDLVKQLLTHCDECLIVSPFLAQDSQVLLSELELTGKRFELISTCPKAGSEQFTKPQALMNFGQYIESQTGHWPVIGLDQKLHAKIYIFSKAGSDFCGIVTSANFTMNGLKHNHETGVLITDEHALQRLKESARNGQDFVNLAQWQLDKLVLVADMQEKANSHDEVGDIGLHNMLNNHCTPSEGNRSVKINAAAKYFIKVSGYKEEPILPADQRVIDEPHAMLTFAKAPKNIRQGDCLLEVAVGGQCFLSYYACASAVAEFTEEEQRTDSHKKRWPHYMYANNLSLQYGKQWFKNPLFYNDVIESFKAANPGEAVTASGGFDIKGTIQFGSSYFEVTKAFAEFVIEQINHQFSNEESDVLVQT
ncbi:restriction endonuclease PLD domain-containing protein [Salinibius halmophilus]|uniref:restriction endonuclease PLD domain-containing protein n=1 Tax=Salinibius halmophilus TaxID=1853216 RepID=UPI000E67013C|nr:restriction endonuclease PLD domain-containing protein [Salinibius halmophilus]